jgi:ring-1,2-phenylacetyl-CoA epoxidase subunit PaaE
MSFFGKIFKKEPVIKAPRGFYTVQVKEINRLTKDSVEIVFDIPTENASLFDFEPGQYINIAVTIDGKEQRRSYSICSAPTSPLAIAIKAVDKGIVSNWANTQLKVGDQLFISKPEGKFVLNNSKNIVGIAAGSGITPLMSMAYAIENMEGASLHLFYANRTEQDILFYAKIRELTKTKPQLFLTQEEKEGFSKGRINKDAFMQAVKNDLSLLKADGFYICGPEEMIMDVKSALELFGVNESKIHYELFTPVVEETSTEMSTAIISKAVVKIVIDDEIYQCETDGKTSILDAANQSGADAPYSCRGGVCSTCRAKIVKGSAVMKNNYTLTDKEVEQGYILTCQAYPTSEELIISYDE